MTAFTIAMCILAFIECLFVAYRLAACGYPRTVTRGEGAVSCVVWAGIFAWALAVSV